MGIFLKKKKLLLLDVDSNVRPIELWSGKNEEEENRAMIRWMI